MTGRLTVPSFWSYEWCKQSITSADDTDSQTAMKVLLCGGLAGVVTWASVFPLDVVKTRVQTQEMYPPAHAAGEREVLLRQGRRNTRLNTFEVAREAYRLEGTRVFFRGLGICSVRAFIVNAVQWAVYEWMMRLLQPN
jgi:solute carrier family 25 carnitine/acylcarnitine transporter 20/29